MDQYILLITIAGLASFAMAWMPAITKRTGFSYAIVYVLAGMLLYSAIPGHLPSPLPSNHNHITMRLTELVVIISLMGTGIKIDRPFSMRNWASPLKLISIAMLCCIAGAAVIGHFLLGMDLASSVLLGAVLAPTDPVLASDVQVGPPNEQIKSETKFTLTAEAGLNDGMAFPFTWLAVSLALAATGSSSGLWHWFSYDFLYRIVVGLLVGYGLGRAIGYLVFTISKRVYFLKTRDGFMALSMTLLVYGITEMMHGYGFVSVFVCAITFRNFEKEHEFHDEIHSFIDQAERILIAIVLLLFGGALVSGILDGLDWKMMLFTVLFLLLLRPLAALVSLATGNVHWKEKLAISFFGIRGLGTIFYLSFAFAQTNFRFQHELWTIIAFTIFISILMHGLTATPIMRHLKKEIPKEDIPR